MDGSCRYVERLSCGLTQCVTTLCDVFFAYEFFLRCALVGCVSRERQREGKRRKRSTCSKCLLLFFKSCSSIFCMYTAQYRGKDLSAEWSFQSRNGSNGMRLITWTHTTM